MGHAGIYGNHHYHHALYLYQTRKPGSYALGTTESARHDHRSLGSIPHDTLPHHQDGAHHCPDGFACLVVSRHLRNQPHVPKSRPYLCRLGAGSFRLSTRPALCQSPALGCSKRTDVDGLLYVLSDDCIGFILLFLLQIL